MAHQHYYLESNEESQFQGFEDFEEEVAADCGEEDEEHVDGESYEDEVKLSLRIIAKCGHNQGEPPQLTEPVNIVKTLTVSDLCAFPYVLLDESEEDFMVSVGIFNSFVMSDGFLLITQPQEVENRIRSPQNKGNDGCSCRYTAKRSLLSFVVDTGELKEAGQHES